MPSDPIKIPPELVDDAARGSCALFLGADAS
jgi:hypothetical protein